MYSTDLLKLEYQYGDLEWDGSVRAGSNNGNVAKETITAQNVGATPGFTAVQNYDYDSRNRIQIASETLTPTTGAPEVWTQNFKYDRFGNRNFVTTGDSATTTLGTCPTEVCNPSISPNTNKITSTGYKFDVAGNTTRDANDRKFTYNAENKLTKVETVENTNGSDVVTGTVGEYWYDSDGKRVKKRAYESNVLTEETIFVYNASGKLVGEYSNQVALAQDAQVGYLTNDHLGSPRINTDVRGNVTARHDYHPFGEEIAGTNRAPGIGYIADAVRKQFTGYERDSAELDFAQARYYSNKRGRFVSTDPENYGAAVFDPQTWNGYAYVANNPVNFVDPDGLEYQICPTDGGKCYTHDDDKVRKAKEEGEYDWVGGRNSKTGLDSGVIKDGNGNVIASYQQTSHDSPIQRMLWGAAPTLRVWKAVIDDVLTPVVTGFAVPPGAGSIVNYGGKGIQAARAAHVAKSAKLAINGAKGAMGEALALATLARDGVEVAGTRVTANLPGGGKRVIDILVKVGDEVVAIEVKTGGATRSAGQLAKDGEMLASGAKLVGKKAGDLAGRTFDKIRTIEMQLP